LLFDCGSVAKKDKIVKKVKKFTTFSKVIFLSDDIVMVLGKEAKR